MRLFSINRQPETLSPAVAFSVPLFLIAIVFALHYFSKKATKSKIEKEYEKILSLYTAIGNNALHIAFKYNTYAEITQLLDFLDQRIKPLALQINNRGKLPAQFILINDKTTEDQKKALFQRIIPLMKNDPIAKISALINPHLVLQRYLSIENKTLKSNLIAGVEALNAARKVIQYSHTHDLINPDNQPLIAKDQLKKNYSFIELQKRIYSSFLPEHKIMCASTRFVNTGNCDAYAYLVEEELDAKGISSEIVCILNGDHTFNVTGRAPTSDPNNPKTWGENAVIIDAWLGIVYRACEVDSYLKNYTRLGYFERGWSTLVPYNSQYHLLGIFSNYPGLPHVPSQNLEEKATARSP